MSRITSSSRRHSTPGRHDLEGRGFKAFLGRMVSHDPWHFPKWTRADSEESRILRPPTSFSVYMEQNHLAAVTSRAISAHQRRQSSYTGPEARQSALPLAPAPLPAIRKGSDGKWIPPTLTKGSASTTAIETFGQDATLCESSTGKKDGSRNARKSSLSVLFTGSAFTTHSIEEEDTKSGRNSMSTPPPVSGLPNASNRRSSTIESPPRRVAAKTRSAEADAKAMPPPPLPLVNSNRSSRLVPRTSPSSGRRSSRFPSETVDEESDRTREEYHLRGRRMSERTLADARARIQGQLSQQSGSLDHLPESIAPDDIRREAISRSLATLEGRPQAQWQPGIVPKRPVAIRSPSVASSHTTLEEPGALSASGSGLLRKTSGSRKMVVPKRTLSPRPPTAEVPFPACQLTYLAPAPILVRSSSAFLQRPVTSMLERRQSEGYPAQHETPINLRLQSMVNLGYCSPLESLSRTSSRPPEGPPQILSFGDGVASVRHQLGNCIGRGQFGSVYRSLNVATGQMVAIKRIRLAGMSEREVEEVMREVQLLQRLKHPSIVRYEGMSRDEEYLNIVLEFVENGSLGQTLKAFGSFNEKLVASYVWKILEGLQYLHSSGVVHCDLKAANILSTKNGNVKLSDFGVSLNLMSMENMKSNATVSLKPLGREGMLSEIAGTPNWMSPEVISLQGASPASDIWSLGCTIIELLTGMPPYSEMSNGMSVLFRIVEDDMPPLPPASPHLDNFLRQCFTKNPKHRPTAQELFNHPWLAEHAPETFTRPTDSIPVHVRAPRLPTHALPPRSTSLQSLTETPPSPLRPSLHEKILRGLRGKRTSMQR